MPIFLQTLPPCWWPGMLAKAVCGFMGGASTSTCSREVRHQMLGKRSQIDLVMHSHAYISLPPQTSSLHR